MGRAPVTVVWKWDAEASIRLARAHLADDRGQCGCLGPCECDGGTPSRGVARGAAGRQWLIPSV